MSIIRLWRRFLATALLAMAEGGAAARGDAGAELLRATSQDDPARVQALLAAGAR